MANKEKAIYVRGLTKKYGRSSKAQLVLDELDMTVEKGIIYGLLGASGCGKTTLLTCILGSISITSGEVWILGKKPGTPESAVPGFRLGYMPQDIALMHQFTITDSLYYFGWIYGMKNEDIEKRLHFLSNLLELPPLDCKIENLSGGQQRRVSMAVALVQDPELIILDEPTVGLDPILRNKIWNYLQDIVRNQNKTVILTTHYIEEARQAHKVGLMRKGKLLAEDSPQKLMRMYECTELEQVFLKLSDEQAKKSAEETVSQKQSDSNNCFRKLKRRETSSEIEFEDSEFPKFYRQNSNLADAVGNEELPGIPATSTSEKNSNFGSVQMINDTDDAVSNMNLRTIEKLLPSFRGHAKALLSKNWYRISRHPGAIIFIFFFPMLELCSFYMTVGGQPQGLKLGVVNEELRNFTTCYDLKSSLGRYYGGYNFIGQDKRPHCHMSGLSCKFLDKIDDNLVIKVPFPDLISAKEAARKGQLIGIIHFQKNFSKGIENRVEWGRHASDYAIKQSEISVWIDKTQYQSALLLIRRLEELQKQWFNETFTECQINVHVGSIPIQMYPAVYGNPHSRYDQFMTPGIVTTMIFFLAVSITSTIMIVEKVDGLWDRTLLTGVSATEILVSHIVIESGVIALQVLEVFIFVFVVFGMPCAGRYIDVVILLVLQGFCGMCAGFLVSVSCDSINASNFVSMGSFYPILLLSGLLWPVEGIPSVLKQIAIALPTTLATNSLRNILEKGWTLTQNHVYYGYLSSIVWICFFSVASIVVIRAKK